MAVQDPFEIIHSTRARMVKVTAFTFNTRDDEPITVDVKAQHYRSTGGDLEVMRTRLAEPHFEQPDVVSAYIAHAATMGITLTAQEVGELIFGGVRRMIEDRYGD